MTESLAQAKSGDLASAKWTKKTSQTRTTQVSTVLSLQKPLKQRKAITL